MSRRWGAPGRHQGGQAVGVHTRTHAHNRVPAARHVVMRPGRPSIAARALAEGLYTAMTWPWPMTERCCASLPQRYHLTDRSLPKKRIGTQRTDHHTGRPFCLTKKTTPEDVSLFSSPISPPRHVHQHHGNSHKRWPNCRRWRRFPGEFEDTKQAPSSCTATTRV